MVSVLLTPLLVAATVCSAAWLPRDATTTTLATLNATATTTSVASPDPFPTNVGFPGKMISGQAPFLVVTDRINGSLGNSPIETRWNATDDDAQHHSSRQPFNIFENLGNTSPYFSSRLFADFQESASVLPESCTVSQVHLLHRHGARYPTSSATEGAPFFGAAIRNVSKINNPNSNFSATGPLSFLNQWSYELGAEVLVPVGKQQLFDSGVHAYYRYGRLYNESTQSHKPVVRTTSQSRMLDSARYFTLGFFGLDAPEKINLQVIIESDAFNNSLASYDTCNNSNTIIPGDDYLRPIWDPIYLANATKRLQPYVTGLNLTSQHVYGMQGLCAYETAALGYSNFCGLFTRAEWEGFEYDLDLEFQGDYGNMALSGRAQGIGWVQEFLSRLTNTSFTAQDPPTTRNTTLDSGVYFPLDQKLYFDFTHDDIIISVLTALNYTQIVGEYLDPRKPDPNRKFILSNITPFAARLAFEVIECNANATSVQPNSKPSQYLRTVLNDAVIPLDAAQGCGSSKNGLCPLDQFISYQQKHALKAANFDKACFGKNGTDFIYNGPVRNGTVP